MLKIKLSIFVYFICWNLLKFLEICPFGSWLSHQKSRTCPIWGDHIWQNQFQFQMTSIKTLKFVKYIWLIDVFRCFFANYNIRDQENIDLLYSPWNRSEKLGQTELIGSDIRQIWILSMKWFAFEHFKLGIFIFRDLNVFGITSGQSKFFRAIYADK